MVTIYVESRTVRVRMPVLSLGRWSGSFLVQIQDCCEDRLDQLARTRTTRRVRRELRARRLEQATLRFEAHERDAVRAMQGRI